jgi:deoxyribonuclease-4
LHINDSKNPLGSNKDRHQNIGKGYIGLSNLKKIIFHPKIINLPKALETPYGKDDFKR